MIRLLVVVDNPLVKIGLVEILKGLDFHGKSISVDGVDSAESALKLIGAPAASYDLAIVDLKLPGMSGYELTRMLNNQATPIPVLVNTELDEEVAADFATAIGAVGFVTKRKPASHLLDAVRQILDVGFYWPSKSVMAEAC
jgi:DNA-binding NarL/FixJ family response regulator